LPPTPSFRMVKTLKTLLATERLIKAFGGLVAVNEVSLEVRENTLTLLIGPNGSGKTTLLNLCTGVLKPDSGKVLFKGQDITGLEPHQIYELGFVRSFQIPMPFTELTVLDNVLGAMRSPGEDPFRAIIKGSWIRREEEHMEKALAILEKVGLERHWNMPSASLGAAQLKMLEVARGLASGATLIALDEPIGGVDPARAGDILAHLTELKKEGITFLVVEHRIDIVAPFADYMYAMDRGSVISHGSPDSVLNDPKVIEVYIGRDEAC